MDRLLSLIVNAIIVVLIIVLCLWLFGLLVAALAQGGAAIPPLAVSLIRILIIAVGVIWFIRALWSGTSLFPPSNPNV